MRNEFKEQKEQQVLTQWESSTQLKPQHTYKNQNLTLLYYQYYLLQLIMKGIWKEKKGLAQRKISRIRYVRQWIRKTST